MPLLQPSSQGAYRIHARSAATAALAVAKHGRPAALQNCPEEKMVGSVAQPICSGLWSGVCRMCSSRSRMVFCALFTRRSFAIAIHLERVANLDLLGGDAFCFGLLAGNACR